MLKEIRKVKNPKFLVITPLRTNDVISDKTLNIIKDNSIQFDWFSFSSKRNIPSNTRMGMQEYAKKYGKLPYFIKIDNDINALPAMLDVMYTNLKNSTNNIAYTYCGFNYVNKDNDIVHSFPLKPFNFEYLLSRSNYISSNSMIKWDKLDEVGGLVSKKKYERLLDYCLWLRFLKNGYIGSPCKTHFDALLTDDNVSARSQQDYKEKLKNVKEDFVEPILELIRYGKYQFKEE